MPHQNQESPRHNNLFRGLAPVELPEFLQQRLQPLFAAAKALRSEEGSTGRRPGDDWWIDISCDNVCRSGDKTRFEYIEFQRDFDDVSDIRCPEAYAYCDHTGFYTVSVVGSGGYIDLSRALRLFSFLQPEADLFNAGYQEVAVMMSYEIIRAARCLAPAREALPSLQDAELPSMPFDGDA